MSSAVSIQQPVLTALRLLLAVSFFAGCAQKPVPQDPQAAAKQTAALQVGAPLTDEECRQFAHDFSEAINARNPTAAYPLIDLEAMISIAAVGLGLSEKEQREFFPDLNTPNGIRAKLIAELQKCDSFEFLRVHSVESSPRVMFRRWQDPVSVNYDDFLLARRSDGRVRAIDFYNFGSGEKISETYRRIMIPLVAKQSAGILSKLQGKESEFVKNFDKLKLIGNCVMGNEPQRALDTIKELPPSLQHDKPVLVLRMRAASQLGNESEYNAAVEDFMRNYPNDASVPITLISYYESKGEYAKALKQVDILDKSVGGDPLLNALRVDVQMAKGDLGKARHLADDMRTLNPDRPTPYWLLISISLRENKFDEVLSYLKLMKSKLNITFTELRTFPDYAEFVKSPQYKEWLEFNEDQ